MMRPTTERILWEGNKTHGIVDLIGAGKDALLMRQGLADGLKDARSIVVPLSSLGWIGCREMCISLLG